MKINTKYLLILPLLSLALVACNGNTDTSSSVDVEIQTDWLEEEKDLIGSVMGKRDAIPFNPIFIEDVDGYFITDYYSVGKITVESLLANKAVGSDGVVHYDPLDDVDEYKEFCLDNDYLLNEDLSDVSAHNYVLTQTVDAASADILETLYLEIYLSNSNYLTVDGWNVIIYQTSVWPSRSNLDAAEQDGLLSIAEMIGLEENEIPDFVSHDENISMDISYRFQMDRGNLSVEMEIATLEENTLSLYANDLAAAGFALDTANSTIEYDNYYNSDSEIDVFLYKNPVDNTHKIKFVAY